MVRYGMVNKLEDNALNEAMIRSEVGTDCCFFFIQIYALLVFYLRSMTRETTHTTI